ncbi:uncharacterized protein [Ptychodera flava]|uniref:uncharacterized protein isoform X1 n=1 Tax=Ptychodera flava TaxID=63121 RepID=UPI003969EED9
MRMVYQVANISNPNVADNTVIWSTFAAPDSYYNLEIALAVNRGQVDKLDGTKWNDKTLLARMMRDYEYLAKSYGLSGPNGKYFCVCCVISKEQAQLPKEEQPLSSMKKRTLDDIRKCHSEFLSTDGNLRHAMQHYNSVRKPLFNVPLHRVCTNQFNPLCCLLPLTN